MLQNNRNLVPWSALEETIRMNEEALDGVLVTPIQGMLILVQAADLAAEQELLALLDEMIRDMEIHIAFLRSLLDQHPGEDFVPYPFFDDDDD